MESQQKRQRLSFPSLIRLSTLSHQIRYQPRISRAITLSTPLGRRTGSCAGSQLTRREPSGFTANGRELTLVTGRNGKAESGCRVRGLKVRVLVSVTTSRRFRRWRATRRYLNALSTLALGLQSIRCRMVHPRSLRT